MSVYAYASKFNYDKERDGLISAVWQRKTCGDTMAVIFNEDKQKLWRCRSCGAIARHPLLIVSENPKPMIREFTLGGDIID